jgi:protocatechuate 3,4-dioxygenase beta subunit
MSVAAHKKAILLLVIIRRGVLLAALLNVPFVTKAQRPPRGESDAGSISGRVTVGGKPAPRIFVTVVPYYAPATSGLPRSFTDEEGDYRLTGVPEGRFVVRVLAPSFVAAEGVGANQAGSRMVSNTGLEGYVLNIAKGDMITGINFELERGGVITGRVTDAVGRPVIGAQVSCSRVDRDGAGGAGERSDTDDRGVYRIYGLPAGSYVVSVTGANMGLRRYRQTFYPDVTSGPRATPVTVAAGSESRDIDIHLGQPEKSFAIRGRVIDEASGRPVPDVSLSFRGLDGPAAGTQGYSTADERGEFEINHYPPGRYELQVAFTGGPNKGYYSDPLIFEVTDADAAGLEIKATRGATISGTVVVEGSHDPTLLGRLYGLSAELVGPEGETGSGGRRAFVSTLIGPGGAFGFGGVRPGRTRIDVGLPEGFQLVRVERDGVPVTAGMDVLPGERVGGVRVVLAYGTGAIHGQARLVGGTPPARFGWLLEVRRAGGERVYFDILDASGRFWVKGLSRGSYEVTATLDYAGGPGVAPERAQVKQAVTVEDGTESLVSLELNLAKADKN